MSELNTMYGWFLEKWVNDNWKKPERLENGSRVEILNQVGNNYEVKIFSYYDCQFSRSTIKVPTNRVLIETGKCFLSESDCYPCFGKYTLNLVSMDCFEYNIKETIDINIVIARKFGWRVWLLIDDIGNQYYHIYNRGEFDDNKSFCYIGRAYGEEPIIRQKLNFYAVKEKFISPNRLYTTRMVDLITIEDVEVVVKLGEMGNRKGNLFCVIGYKDVEYYYDRKVLCYAFLHMSK